MDELREYLLNLEELAWEATRKGDAGFFAAYLTDDAVAVASRGRFGKATVLAGLTDSSPLTAVRIRGPRLLRLACDAALLSYQATVDVTPKGDLSTFGVFATTVYVRRDGVWYAAFSQLTPIDG